MRTDMNEHHTIQIINDLMVVLDAENNGCNSHQLRSMAEAEGQLLRWREEYKFDYAGALAGVAGFFRGKAVVRQRVDVVLEKIARDVLHITTLSARGSDQLDFYQLGVGQIRLALRAAFEAGKASMK
jgi:hypothetical protein